MEGKITFPISMQKWKCLACNLDNDLVAGECPGRSVVVVDSKYWDCSVCHRKNSFDVKSCANGCKDPSGPSSSSCSSGGGDSGSGDSGSGDSGSDSSSNDVNVFFTSTTSSTSPLLSLSVASTTSTTPSTSSSTSLLTEAKVSQGISSTEQKISVEVKEDKEFPIKKSLDSLKDNFYSRALLTIPCKLCKMRDVAINDYCYSCKQNVDMVTFFALPKDVLKVANNNCLRCKSAGEKSSRFCGDCLEEYNRKSGMRSFREGKDGNKGKQGEKYLSRLNIPLPKPETISFELCKRCLQKPALKNQFCFSCDSDLEIAKLLGVPKTKALVYAPCYCLACDAGVSPNVSYCEECLNYYEKLCSETDEVSGCRKLELVAKNISLAMLATQHNCLHCRKEITPDESFCMDCRMKFTIQHSLPPLPSLPSLPSLSPLPSLICSSSVPCS